LVFLLSHTTLHGSMNVKFMNWGLIHSSGDRFISSPKHPVWFQNPLNLLFSRYQWFFPLVTFLHQVPRLRMKLTPPPLPCMTLWGVKVQLCDILHIITNLLRRSCNSLHPSCPMFSLLRPVHDITNWSPIISEVFPNVLYLVGVSGSLLATCHYSCCLCVPYYRNSVIGGIFNSVMFSS